MTFWNSLPPTAANLRLFEKGIGWRAYSDMKDPEGKITSQGALRSIEQHLTSALNASSLLMLTGAGSSYCAVNRDGRSAPSMAGLWDAVQQAAGQEPFNKIVSTIPNAMTVGKNIEKLLTLCKLYTVLFEPAAEGEIGKFITLAESTIHSEVDFVDDDVDLSIHKNLIRKFARRSVRKPRAKLFTTNYDLCFEYAAREQQFVLIDGFSHSMPQSYDRAHFNYDIVRREGDVEAPNYIENVFHLYKLHGSIDWRRQATKIIRSRDALDGEPVLIYPRDSKFQEAFESPYLDMMGAFQTAIREPDAALLISGFGFNDDHISKPIMAAIEANMSLRLVVCDLAFLTDDALVKASHILPTDTAMRVANNPYWAKLKALVEAGDQRIVLLNGRFSDLADALPDLVAQTERERHLDRINRVRELSAT